MTLTSARRVGHLLAVTGVLVVAIGILACTRGMWPLAVLGALCIVVGAVAALVGLGMRARVAQALEASESRELDAKVLAAINRSGTASCDEAHTPCSACDLGCAVRSHP
ncbi:MAG: hypothetical protein ACR2KJ_13295 [Jatrophihabitans sp.]